MSQVTYIRHIVFDIGKVLIHYDPDIAYQKIIPDAEKRAWFFDNVCTSAWNLEQDRGRAWGKAETLLISQHPQWQAQIRAFRENWREMVPYAYNGTVGLLLSLLDNGHDITFLTNFAADTFVEAQSMYPFLKVGRGATVSGRVKLIKPDPAIYALHTKTYELEPSATLFIDDSPANVEAAQAFGWQAIHFTSPGALADQLASYSLLAND